jgi:hypothetical protein
MLYWAYGSNLCVERIRRRCPAARKARAFAVHDAALVFRGVADVVIRTGSVVPGGLWHITPECEAELDRYEGIKQRLYLKRYLPLKIDGQVWKCLFYQMATSRGIMPPGRDYADTIARGYRDFGLDVRVLNAAIAESWDNQERTNFLRRRYWEKGSPRLAPRPLITKEENAS